MPRAKLFINNVERDLLKACVPREACRSLDQGKFDLPAFTDVCSSDEITYVQDMVNLGSNRLLFNFCFHPKDESGYAHHIIGHCVYPSSLSHWCFQNALTDTGLKSNNLTVVCGCATYTTGKTNTVACGVARAFCFDGIRHLTAPNESCYDFENNQKFSLAVWVFPGMCGAGTDIIMGKRAGLTNCAGYTLFYQTCPSNRVRFEIGNGTTEWFVQSTCCSIPQCMFTHIVVTYDAQLNQNGMKVYINGELDSTGTSCAITGSSLNNCVFTIGALIGGTNDFLGRMDDVRVFADKELTACQVASLYHDGAVSYNCGQWDGKAIEFDGESGHGAVPDVAPADPQPTCLVSQFKFECNLTDNKGCNNGTVMCGCETYVAGLIDCKAFCFCGGGCGRYITLANEGSFDFERTCKFSISTWIKTTTAATETLIGKGISGSCIARWQLTKTSTGLARFVIQNANTNRIRITTTSTINDGNWHHLVGTYDGSSLSIGTHIYIDGEQVCITVNCDNLTSSILNNTAVTIGANGSAANTFGGQLDCVRIWKTELTIKEVRRLYQSTYGTHNGQYEYITWLKAATSGCARTVFHKATCATDGVQLRILPTACMSVATWRQCGTTVTGALTVADGCTHQLRIKRDMCNLVTLYVDNVADMCATITTDPTSTSNLEFARSPTCTEYFDGCISSFRFYHGNLPSTETCRLFSKRNPRSNIKFGGNSTKITKSISKKKLVTQSFSKKLGDIEVRASQFCCRTPEFILETLVKCNTDLDTHFHGTPSGITLQVYQADGKLVDIANDLSQLSGKVYSVDGVKQFHLHDSTFNLTTASFTHGVAMRNIDSAEDDTEIVNDLLIIGANKRYVTSCMFTGDGIKTVFCLSEGPVTARVEHPILTELCPEVDYEVCPLKKNLTFTVAPVCGACNILIEYEFERPLNIRGTKPSSIAEFGTKAKRLVLPWIQNRPDGTRFIQAYLNNFQDVKNRFEVTIPGLANGIDVHDVITITNDIKNISGTFIIKSITWQYPKGLTLLHVGEFDFQMLEFAKQITEKIHDLESAVTTSKDIRDFESPEEILVITDTLGINVNLQTTPETLALTTSGESERKFKAFYNRGIYNVDIYATEHPE